MADLETTPASSCAKAPAATRTALLAGGALPRDALPTGPIARKVKHFIRSFGTLGKTDALDAEALAHYGRERHSQLARWQAPDQHRDRLQVMVLARQDLVAQRQASKNRLAAPGVEPVKAAFQAIVACLDTEIKRIDRSIQTLIETQAPLKKAAAALRTVGGFGPVVTAGLLGLMPELGSIDRRKIENFPPLESNTNDGDHPSSAQDQAPGGRQSSSAQATRCRSSGPSSAVTTPPCAKHGRQRRTECDFARSWPS